MFIACCKQKIRKNMKKKQLISLPIKTGSPILYYSYFLLQIVYYNFTDAFEVAKKENRLVHHILLWGALDDQSCWGSGRTLRETALESTPVLALLNESFVSSWSLVADLKVSAQLMTISFCVM